jgi:hypothetical protein
MCRNEAAENPAARVTSVLVPASSREAFGRRPLTAAGLSPDSSAGQENSMIILGVILLVVGFVAKIAILWTIGIVVLVIGLILVLLGAVGHAVGGRRHYW